MRSPKYGKMRKYLALKEDSDLIPHLPETFPLSYKAAKQLLKTYGSVFIKPDTGTGGVGIIKVTQKDKQFVVAKKHSKKEMSKERFKAYLTALKRSRRYIAQQGIKLAKYKDRVFDIRIYMQKPKKEWSFSGIVVRVAPKKQFITNYHQGGYGITIEKALAELFNNDQDKMKETYKQIKKIAFRVTKANDKSYRMRQIGIDLGLEADGKPWIIEMNFRPMHKLFAKLKDKSMYRTIVKNKRYITKNYKKH